MEQDKGLSKGTQCSLCKTSSALGLCCRDDLALTLAPRLQPILPPWNRCPAQFPSSCPPTQPPNPNPHPTCAQFCPSSHQNTQPFRCLHFFVLHFFTFKDFQHPQSFLICQKIRADQIVVVLRLRAPLWGAGGLTLALGNTGAHGTKHPLRHMCLDPPGSGSPTPPEHSLPKNSKKLPQRNPFGS